MFSSNIYIGEIVTEENKKPDFKNLNEDNNENQKPDYNKPTMPQDPPKDPIIKNMTPKQNIYY